MKALVSLMLLLTCIALNAENEGPSEYLKSKWREIYTNMRQSYSRRCVRTCSPLEDDLIWEAVGGKATMSWSESKFTEYLTNAYNNNLGRYIDSVRRNVRLGIQYLDADKNGVISAEEFYTENLCMGFGIDAIIETFDSLKTVAGGIPNDRFIDSLIDYFTNANDTSQPYDIMKNNSVTYNDVNPI